jgi:hypothetical protein
MRNVKILDWLAVCFVIKYFFPWNVGVISVKQLVGYPVRLCCGHRVIRLMVTALFDQPNNIWWRVQTINLHILQFCPVSYYFLPLLDYAVPQPLSEFSVPFQHLISILVNFFTLK